jgi:hypothetical protein
MKKYARTDSNQAAIVKALRKAGYSVLSLAPMGKGCPDLLVNAGGDRLRLLEIKDGSKPPSQQRLTPDQIKFHQAWPVVVVTAPEQAIRAMEGELF